MNWDELFEKKKIIVCCGSGGVGKTTTSAAIALEAARRGKRAIVLTIDPAKRLATAMGLNYLGNTPKEIPLITSGGRFPSKASDELSVKSDGGYGGRAVSPPVAKSRSADAGRLFAMMLDTKRTFDRIIEKYAPAGKREDIFNNRLYQHLSNMVAGSQEYMAMERLYELYQEGRYDVLVLDTPPTRHALDFLEAPQKMANLTGNSALKWFLKPGIFAGRIGLGALQKGAEKFLSVFDRLAGLSFLSELSEMLLLISNLLGGFHDRAEAVYALLRERFVGFILVTSPASVTIQDSLFFYDKIRDYDLPFLGFIINRVHPPLKTVETSAAVSGFLPPPLKAKLARYLGDYRKLSSRDQKAIALLKKCGGKKALYAQVPLFINDVHDMEGLERMNEEIFRAR